VLAELRIENLLLIERAELRFGEGLNVITGETGAGKTILAHSLDLLMGGKAREGIVRPGASEAYVEGVFLLPDGLLDDPEFGEIAERLPAGAGEGEEGPGRIVLGRRVSASGRTSAFVAGRSASAADLKALGGRLLAFYGQHEHRKLTLSSAQMEILDGFAGAKHMCLRRRYREAHAEVAELDCELAELREREGARERDLDLLRYELEEIDAAGPDATDERELEAERDRLRHAEGLRAASGESMEAIVGEAEGGGGAAAALGEAEVALGRVAELDASLDRIAERIRVAAVELGDVAAELRAYGEGIDAAPGRLQEVEERLDLVDRLKRKHGGSIEAVLAHAERCRTEIERLENAEERAAELERRLEQASATRSAFGEELSASRKAAGDELEGRVGGELAALAMSGATLEVALEPHPQGFGPAGRESVELRLATNPGMPVAPLRDAASGGELSRVMLALSGLGSAAGAGTLVFDEIDAGIGGNTARAVGERLRRLGEEKQLICITHLPSVASVASTHFRIEKTSEADTVRARVERVDGDELVAEITRMLGANRDDEAASRHARQLLAA
jgi:DNA repair protein RecN (Recombination protein N)